MNGEVKVHVVIDDRVVCSTDVTEFVRRAQPKASPRALLTMEALRVCTDGQFLQEAELRGMALQSERPRVALAHWSEIPDDLLLKEVQRRGIKPTERVNNEDFGSFVFGEWQQAHVKFYADGRAAMDFPDARIDAEHRLEIRYMPTKEEDVSDYQFRILTPKE